MKEGPLVQMLDRQRVQQAAADEAKKLVDAAALAAERLVDATKEAEETATAAAAAAALSPAEDLSVQRASASLPDSVPIESEEERAAREEDEMAALDAVGDHEADPNVMLEDVPQDIVIKTLKVCMCSCVGVLRVCVCV
jgi:hypothetical protein